MGSARRYGLITTILLSSTLLAIALAAPADPTHSLEKRKATLSKSNTITIAGKAPLDAIILIGFGLLAALICLFIALWNVYMPYKSGSQELRDERARAKTELRLKGGKSGNAISPILRNVAEKKHSHFVGADVIQSNQEISKRLDLAPAYTTPRDRPSGPRVAPDASNARASRASRSFQLQSPKDANETPSAGSSTPLSFLALPVLPGAYSDDYSTPSTSNLSPTTPPIPGSMPWQHRPSQDHQRSHMTHTKQFSSSSIARGIDLNRKRESLRFTKNLINTPEGNDAIYPFHPHHQIGATRIDPLSSYEQKQYPPDPSYDLDKTVADDFVNAYDAYGHINNGIYDVPSYDQNNLTTQIPNPYAIHLQDQIQPVAKQGSPTKSIGSITRSKPLAFYDLEQDLGGVHQDTALLDGNSPLKQSPRKLWAQS